MTKHQPQQPQQQQQQQQQQTNIDIKLETIRWHQKLQEITYLEAGQHMRALNQLMWQIPSFAIAVNGGLWYATTLVNQNALWIIFAVLALFDLTTIITIYRLRCLIGKKIHIQNKIENPSSNAVLAQISNDAGFTLTPVEQSNKAGYIVVSCWSLMLFACFLINLQATFAPEMFSKSSTTNHYKATLKNNSTGFIIEATSGEAK